MAIGERINFFRRRCNLTMSALGQLLGFDAKGADVRIAQYENNSRKPKAELTQSMADVFGVVPEALTVPDIDTYKGLLHTLLPWRIFTALLLIALMMSHACIWTSSSRSPEPTSGSIWMTGMQ